MPSSRTGASGRGVPSSGSSAGRRLRACTHTFWTMRKIQVDSLASPRKYGNAAVHLQEHVLREIVRQTAIRHHPVDQPEDQILVAIDELAERGVVTGPAPFDQLAIVEIHPPAVLECRPG